MRRAALPFVALLLLVSMSAPAAPVLASPEPTYVCSVCGQQFVNAADERGVDVTVERSELFVRVGEDGDSRWRARITVDEESAGAFRENESLLDAAVDDALEPPFRTVHHDARNVSERVGGDTVVVTFDVPEIARNGVGGTLLVDRFNAGGSARYYVLGADRFELSGPDGTVVTNDPPGATLEDGNAVWTVVDGNGWGTFDERTYVTFNDNRGFVSTIAGQASIAAGAAPYVSQHAFWAALPATLVLAVGLAATRWWYSRRERDPSLVGTAALVAVGSGTLALALTVAGTFGGFHALALVLAVQFATVAPLAATWPERLTERRVVALTVAPIVGGAALIVGVDADLAATTFLTVLCFGLAVALLFPLGYAMRRGRGARALAATALLMPATAILPTVPVRGVFGPLFAGLVYGALAIPVFLVGSLLFRLGWALAASPHRRPSEH